MSGDLHFRQAEEALAHGPDQARESDDGPCDERCLTQIERGISQTGTVLLSPAQRQQPAGDDESDPDRNLRESNGEQEPLVDSKWRQADAAEGQGTPRDLLEAVLAHPVYVDPTGTTGEAQ